MWYDDALKEVGLWQYYKRKLLRKAPPRDYAIYPRSFWQHPALAQEKSLNYCFIGALMTDEETFAARQWMTEFIKSKFDENSYLQFTDRKTRSDYQSLGPFDFTAEKTGLVPKEVPRNKRNMFDENYFTVMAKSQFVLCPAGDAPWSMRFYESLMCKAIPVVETRDHTRRSAAEAELDYKVYLPHEEHVYREDWVEHNYEIFMRHHTFANRLKK
jgi:Exostosin family